MLDLCLIAVLAIVTWCVAAEGVWGAALTFFAVLFGGLLAMNFFEPIAELVSTGSRADYYFDFVTLIGLFAIATTLIRVATDALMPAYVEVLPMLYDIGRWVFGLLTGYVTMAFLATAVQTAPLPRTILDFVPEQKMLFGLAPDRQWLAYTQYVSEKIYRRGNIFDGEQFPSSTQRWLTANTSHERQQQMQTWSSFPMRYALRREEYMRGASGAGAGPTAPSLPAPPAGGAAGGGPGF